VSSPILGLQSPLYPLGHTSGSCLNCRQLTFCRNSEWHQGRSQKFILGGYNFYCTILQSYILAAWRHRLQLMDKIIFRDWFWEGIYTDIPPVATPLNDTQTNNNLIWKQHTQANKPYVDGGFTEPSSADRFNGHWLLILEDCLRVVDLKINYRKQGVQTSNAHIFLIYLQCCCRCFLSYPFKTTLVVLTLWKFHRHRFWRNAGNP